MYKNQFVGSRDFPEIKKQDEEKRKIKKWDGGSGASGRTSLSRHPHRRVAFSFSLRHGG